MDLKKVIDESFTQYSAAVLQSRALVDVRDCIKPSARQIFYCMYTDKFIHNKPFQKTLKAIGSAMRIYIHGDSSCEGIIMRAGQPFSMRYPLVEIEGNGGNLISSGNYAAPRYTAARLSALAEYLFADLQKNTVDEWRLNYDDSEQYPAILPSKGFYNLVNGNFGIAIGAASSIPQYNLKELNNALITLIKNPNCDFDEIYCAPDFATGATIINMNEVKESHKKGTGFACKIRSTVEWDNRERCFVVTEIPYMVYTETICKELEDIINGDTNPGIERFNDLTGKQPLIKIYLTKMANPDRVLKYLYKNTSLQYYYGVNFTMLDNGRFPKVFTWKEMLQAHIDHEKVVYRRGFEYDLKKIEDRIHIIDGLIICIANIEEVVQIIKTASNTTEAGRKLKEKFLLDDTQVKAVLDMRLARLAHLEVQKLEDERANLQKEAERISNILNNDELFANELIKGWREVAEKFGDARRTRLMQLETDSDEPIEKKQLSLAFTNDGAVFVSETSTLYTQKRNGVGTKFKLNKDEYVVDNLIGENTDTALFFTSHGNFYHVKMGGFTINEKQYLNNFVQIHPYEHIVAATILSKQNTKPYILFITKKGIVKKSALIEYNMQRNGGAIAIKLDQNDEIINALVLNEEKIGILSQKGNFIMINTKDIRAIGRSAKGVIGMKLNADDYVVNAHIIEDGTIQLVSISTTGFIKRTNLNEFQVTGRGTKGVKLQKAEDVCDFLPIKRNEDIMVIGSKSQIRLKLDDVPILGRGAQGVKAMKLTDAKIIKIEKI